MADMKQIYDFAVKWIDKFRDLKINYLELVDNYMADDCAALGSLKSSQRKCRKALLGSV